MPYLNPSDEKLPSLPPPVLASGIVGWTRKNLLSSKLNIFLTLVSLLFLVWSLPPLIDWALISPTWSGEAQACQENKGGACWAFVAAKGRQFAYGFYPISEIWRVNIIAVILFFGIALLIYDKTPGRKWIGLFLVLIFPVFSWFFLLGGAFGLEVVPTNKWGGFMMTIIIASTGIGASLPLGILLALGRVSKMQAIRSFCVIFIEFWRGIPLITVLFMAAFLLPLFFREGINFDMLLRALVGVALFSSAYMAEVIRGGLQGISKGQYEGADSLGLNYVNKMRLIILPQAIKIVIPSIVNTFIGLFKDTTLVLIIGLFDFLGIIDAGIRDPKWLIYNIHHTGYAFCALIFFICCFSMSYYSKRLEKKLDTGHQN